MNRFTLQLEALSGRDMPSAGWAQGLGHAGEPVVEIQQTGGLAGGIEGAIERVRLAGGAAGGVVGSGGAAGGIVMGGLNGGVVLGSPGDPSTPIDVDSFRSIGEEIPSFMAVVQASRSTGEEIPSFMSIGEEIPT
jgi:hypothetical protein